MKPAADGLEDLLLDTGTLHERAYAVIRQGLMSGRFQPGQKLLLRPLAKELGISVTPLREALLQLVCEQALTTDCSRSLAVPVVGLQRFLEIRDLRIELEGRAVEAAVGLARAADVAALAKLQRQLLEHRRTGNFCGALNVNERFHFAIYRLAQMPVLFRIIEGLWLRIGPVLTRLYNRVEHSSIDSQHPHELLLVAMRRKDAPAARLALASDIASASRRLEAMLSP